MSWDDFRYFLAAARAGSMSGAARALKVDQATVSRRLAALEHTLATALFRRAASGLTLTGEGEAVLARAEEAEAAVQATFSAARASTIQPQGCVRVATNELLAVEILAPAFPEFLRRYPNVELELEVGQAFVSLPRGEADLAVRLRPHGKLAGQPSLLARKLGEVAFAAYIASADAPPERPLIRYSESAPFDPGAGHPALPERPARVRASSVPVMRALISAGVGLGVLPCFVGDAAGLQRVGEPVEWADVWALVPPELRAAPAIRATMSFVTELFQRPEIQRRLQGRPTDLS